SVADPNDAGTSYATVRITGANLQLVDGSGDTDGPANGLGNLIVGYHEADPGSAIAFCSSGSYDDQSSCEDNGETWASNQRSGSHNLVVGMHHGYSRFGGLVAGRSNAANGIHATVAGLRNLASGSYATVAGGLANVASGAGASVGGGSQNRATGSYAAVSGGL